MQVTDQQLAKLIDWYETATNDRYEQTAAALRELAAARAAEDFKTTEDYLDKEADRTGSTVAEIRASLAVQGLSGLSVVVAARRG